MSLALGLPIGPWPAGLRLGGGPWAGMVLWPGPWAWPLGLTPWPDPWAWPLGLALEPGHVRGVVDRLAGWMAGAAPP